MKQEPPYMHVADCCEVCIHGKAKDIPVEGGVLRGVYCTKYKQAVKFFCVCYDFERR